EALDRHLRRDLRDAGFDALAQFLGRYRDAEHAAQAITGFLNDLNGHGLVLSGRSAARLPPLSVDLKTIRPPERVPQGGAKERSYVMTPLPVQAQSARVRLRRQMERPCARTRPSPHSPLR